jgi:hypothetical protein
MRIPTNFMELYDEMGKLIDGIDQVMFRRHVEGSFC